jgi:hypothetical protein
MTSSTMSLAIAILGILLTWEPFRPGYLLTVSGTLIPSKTLSTAIVACSSFGYSIISSLSDT